MSFAVEAEVVTPGGEELRRIEGLALRVASICESVGHPIRLRVLAWGYAHPAERISSVRVAAELDEALPNVSYHVRKLHGAKMLRAAGEAQRRGAIEHFYVLTAQARRCMESFSRLVETDDDE